MNPRKFKVRSDAFICGSWRGLDFLKPIDIAD
jgi:hypothetical protein